MNYSKNKRVYYKHKYNAYTKKSEHSMSEIEQEKQLTHHMIPIKWNVPDNIQSLYASNVFVQACEYEISLLFFETQLPLLTGSSEEIINQLKEIDAVQAK